jgi:uracil-DNA glycosylase
MISGKMLPQCWRQFLKAEFNQPYMNELNNFLDGEYSAKKTIYPQKNKIFEAFNLCKLADTKVVILGQDPYHGAGQAHGLCFSVEKEVKIPPSLVNIYKELKSDIGLTPPSHGNLESWAKQGVLMLNSVLTVEHSLAASHAKKGWETFTKAVIDKINADQNEVVFVLWGGYAKKVGKGIPEKNIVADSHPSPLSSYRGFLGGKSFSRVNKKLKGFGKTPIDWQIPD